MDISCPSCFLLTIRKSDPVGHAKCGVFARFGLSYRSYPDDGTLKYPCLRLPNAIPAVYWLRWGKRNVGSGWGALLRGRVAKLE